MSIVQGTNIIAGIGRSLEKNANNLLEARWFDHIVNNIEWLRSDTFSWQDGTVYTSAYNHLSADISGKTLQSETIGAVTVQFYLADDGHKICPASEESNVASIYTNTGVAWYYIIDTTNTRFKLPRSTYRKFSKNQTLPVKGNGMTLGATDGTDNYGFYATSNYGYTNFHQDIYGKNVGSSSGGTYCTSKSLGITTDASKSGIVAEYQDFADTNMHLYFYVGEFSQTATEQTAGLNAELFNGKADTTLSNINASASAKETIVGWGMPDYSAIVNLAVGTILNFPCDAIGYVQIPYSNNQSLDVSIDGVSVFYARTSGGYGSPQGSQFLIPKGSTVVITGNLQTGYYAPLKANS